jgi:hypothetical protein
MKEYNLSFTKIKTTHDYEDIIRIVISAIMKETCGVTPSVPRG